MGKPATPTPAARAATRELAAAVVRSVEEDERMPHGLAPAYDDKHRRLLWQTEVEDLLAKLAQEIVSLSDELKHQHVLNAQYENALSYLARWKGDDQHHANAEEIASGNMVSDETTGEAVWK